MKRLLLAGLLLGASTLTLMNSDATAAPPFPFLGGKPATPAKGEIKWQKDIFTAHKLAQQQNKPMLLVFGADWCGFCKKLESQTLAQPELADYINQNFIPVHLDADKDERVTKILEVESLPCSIVLSPTADLLGRIDGYYPAETFQSKLVAAKAGQAKPPVSQVRGE